MNVYRKGTIYNSFQLYVCMYDETNCQSKCSHEKQENSKQTKFISLEIK